MKKKFRCFISQYLEYLNGRYRRNYFHGKTIESR